MKTYCAKERMKTECVPGSERSLVTKNGRSLIKCVVGHGLSKVSFSPLV